MGKLALADLCMLVAVLFNRFFLAVGAFRLEKLLLFVSLKLYTLVSTLVLPVFVMFTLFISEHDDELEETSTSIRDEDD